MEEADLVVTPGFSAQLMTAELVGGGDIALFLLQKANPLEPL